MRQHVIGSWTQKIAEIIHLLKTFSNRIMLMPNAHIILDWGLEPDFETKVATIGLETPLSGRQTQIFLH